MADRRSRTHTDRKRGRYIQARPAAGDTSDLAFDATLRAAAPFPEPTYRAKEESGFCHSAHGLSTKGKGAQSSQSSTFPGGCLLVNGGCRTYGSNQRRHPFPTNRCVSTTRRVGLIVFQKDRATLVLPPYQLRISCTKGVGRNSSGWQDTATRWIENGI